MSRSMCNHKKTHAGFRPFQCDSCESAFYLQNTLDNHKKRFHGTRGNQFACSVCEKTFYQSSGLKEHMVVHTGERPYSCDSCGSKFKRGSHLKQHQRTCKQIKSE